MKAKMIIGGAVLAASALAGTAVAGPFSANIGVTNNYIFRGVTQTDDVAAVQGGVDFEHDSGFYAGTWLSNVGSLYEASAGNNNYEQDWYAGYGFEAGPVGLDAGFILYTYPVDSNAKFDYGEIYVNVNWQWLSGGLAYTVFKEEGDTGDIYLHFSGDFEAGNGLGFGFTVGRYDYKAGGDYNHVRLYMSKSDFTLALDKNDLVGPLGDYRFTVAWGKSFDL